MNSVGRLFRISIFGESHGECVGITIDGCPAGVSLSPEDLLADLDRRKGGKQKGTTPRQEEDYPIFKSGVFNGKTTGFPITILFENKNTRSEDYNQQRSIPRPLAGRSVAAARLPKAGLAARPRPACRRRCPRHRGAPTRCGACRYRDGALASDSLGTLGTFLRQRGLRGADCGRGKLSRQHRTLHSAFPGPRKSGLVPGPDRALCRLPAGETAVRDSLHRPRCHILRQPEHAR